MSVGRGGGTALRLVAIGRARSGPEQELFDRYAKRLRPALQLVEIGDGRGPPGEIRRQEALALLGALPAQALVVALDTGGSEPDSVELSGRLEQWQASGRALCFVIGGAEGLEASVLDRANHRLSLGRLTWPHMLVRVMLAEQLYRAQSIRAGHPYHRSLRP